MKTLRCKKTFVIPIVVCILEFVWLYFNMSYIISNNTFIKINSVTWDNIGIKFIQDYCSMLLLPTVVIIINKKNLNDFSLQYKCKKEIFTLLVVMVILFFLHNDFTITGVYKFFFYLVVVAFAEEFIYRGYLYNRLKSNSKAMAIILSGILWGIPHAILPSILTNLSTFQILLSMCSQIGGGIVMGLYFIYIQEKSKTLWVPILVHAILDYSVSYSGVFIAIVAFIYFRLMAKKQNCI